MLGYYDYTVWLTYCSLCSSIAGLFLGFSGYPVEACFCLLLCALFDTFDGMVARTKKDRTGEEKRFGIQIDSLSDLVAFGVLPGAVGFGIFFKEERPFALKALFCCAAAALALAALIRLAYFNVDEGNRQECTSQKRTEYEGLPVTSSAGIAPLLAVTCLLLRLDTAGIFLYMAGMLAMGFLFICGKLRIRKPSARDLVLLLIVGVVEVSLLLYCLGGV